MANMYDPITQLKAVEKLPPVHTFLYDLFVEEGKPVASEKAEFDYRKGSQRMAPFVESDVGGIVFEREGYDTMSFMFPTLAPERPIRARDLRERLFGENIYSGKTPEDRARELTIEDLVYLQNSIAMRKEWMTAQLLFTGKMDLKIFLDEGMTKTAPYTINFGFDNFFNSLNPWTEADSDPIIDQEALMEIVRDGMGMVDTIIMASDVKTAMFKNKALMEKLNLRNANFGEIAIQYRDNGVQYLGTNQAGIDMLVYSGKYRDDDGAEKNYVPAGKILYGSRKMLQVDYGPVTQIEQDGGDFKTYLAKEVPLRYSSIRSNSKAQRLTSRPFIRPKNVDGWAVGDVI